jgi:Cu/Ag efflux pump CusA
VPGTRSVFAERTGEGYFLETSTGNARSRYGLSIDDAQMAVQSAIGGDNVTTTIGHVEEAGRLLTQKLKLAAGYAIAWSGRTSPE